MIAYITGASSGIGKALAEFFLDQNYEVIGLSRRQKITHKNYKHISIDLSDIKQIDAYNFPKNSNDNIILVNNAGTVGPIKPIGQQRTNEIVSMNNLNIVAPQVLSNKFINQYIQNENCSYQIVNISSGAGKRPIDAWATYCASKAAIDLFSETISKELSDRNHTNWRVYSIAPGVVDTEMQAAIRSSKPSNFLNHQKFVELKNNNELSSAELVAKKLSEIIHQTTVAYPVIFSLKDIV